MKKAEFKMRVFEAFSLEIDDLTYAEKIRLLEKYLVEYQQKNDGMRDKPNSGKE